MSAPLSILHCTHDGRGAGSSVSIGLLAQAQLRAGHRVALACPPGFLSERARANGIEWTPLASGTVGGAARDIARRCAELGPDVVNAHSSKDRAACRRLRFAGRLAPALVMTRRAMPRSSPLSAVASGLAADRVIAVSEAVARALIRRGTPASRVTVVYNALDTARMDRVVTEAERERAIASLKTADGRWQMAELPTIGVVSRRKDHETLVRAMGLLKRPAALVSVGFEPDAALRGLSAAIHHPPSAIPPTWLPFDPDPRPYYDLFDVVVLPTNEEGLSQGLMEAMALGKAIVTTRCGGNPELIEDGVHGLLVAPGDPVALAEALGRLLGDGALAARLGAAASERVRLTFTIERTLALTGAAYRTALARRPAA